MNHHEKLLAGKLYNPMKDGLAEGRLRAQTLVHQFNLYHPGEKEKRQKLIQELFGKTGENFWVEQPFYCDYGSHIEIGENFYCNFHCTILDSAKVKIGKNAMFGPNVSILTAGHPVHPDNRYSGYEFAMEITIGDNVWLGGNVIVNPGVRIGNNVVVGSGSVVTKDIPDNTIAVGNPAKVIREITDEDRNYYYKKLPFIIED